METIRLKIIDLDNKARGVARDSGLIYFVEGAKLGEEVLAQVKKVKKSFAEAVKIQTLVESSFLTGEDYEDKDLCGIYEIHDLNYQAQMDFKKNSIISSLNRIAGLDLDHIDFYEAPKKTNYRNKVELKVDPEGYLSFFSRASNQNIRVKSCVMNSMEINKVVPVLQDLIHKLKIPGYDPRTNRGVLKNIMLRSTSLGQVQMVIVFNEEFDFGPIYKDLEKIGLVTSLFVSRNTRARNYKILDLIRVFGPEKIEEDLGGYKFKISPKAFMQVSNEVSYQIYMDAKKHIEKIRPDLLIDLYSGISTTSILLADICEKIVSVEISQEAIQDARENAKINDVKNIEWINKPAEVAIEQIAISGTKPSLLVDPPRAGLEENIINKIGQSSVKDIVYISCDPGTLARDIKRFSHYGFEVVEVKGYDQFFGTVHVETVVLMSRVEEKQTQN